MDRKLSVVGNKKLLLFALKENENGYKKLKMEKSLIIKNETKNGPRKQK